MEPWFLFLYCKSRPYISFHCASYLFGTLFFLLVSGVSIISTTLLVLSLSSLFSLLGSSSLSSTLPCLRVLFRLLPLIFFFVFFLDAVAIAAAFGVVVLAVATRREFRGPRGDFLRPGGDIVPRRHFCFLCAVDECVVAVALRLGVRRGGGFGDVTSCATAVSLLSSIRIAVVVVALRVCDFRRGGAGFGEVTSCATVVVLLASSRIAIVAVALRVGIRRGSAGFGGITSCATTVLFLSPPRVNLCCSSRRDERTASSSCILFSSSSSSSS